MSDVTGDTGNVPNYLDPPPRTVRPRTREYAKLPVIAIQNDATLAEDGEVGTLDDLIVALPKMTPTLFVSLGSADLLARLDTFYAAQFPTSWQFRVSNYERDICLPDGTLIASRVSLAIKFFGWKNGNYHKLIDPVTMYGKRLSDIMPSDISKHVEGGGGLGPAGRLLSWGIMLRDFCDENNIEIRPTMGSISAQFLTDPRFYPDARRKIPACINQRVREQLPGNHYHLEADTDDDTEYTAIYIDQSRAHHYHARNIKLPDANFLYASGNFINLDTIAFTELPTDFHGLLCVDLEAPTTPIPFDWLTRPEQLDRRFIFTNELPHVLDSGYKIIGVRAAWGGHKRDIGIPRYAAWASLQLDSHHNAAWLKPILLSAYGMLAMKPRYAEAVFRLARSGIPTSLPTGRRKLSGLYVCSSRKLEPGVANVLHRGMIEAATRSESIGLAQYLSEGLGFKVLSIYADAVIIEKHDHRELPVLPEPWRVKQELTHLQFLNQQAFLSGEMTKLPGISGGDILKHTRRAHPPAAGFASVAAKMEAEEMNDGILGDN